VRKAVEPAGEAKSHREILSDIAMAMGTALTEARESETKRLSKIGTQKAFSPFIRKEGIDVNSGEIIESLNSSVINGSRLLWIKESEKTLEESII
jgi:predicted molibdopterin-dependent oxidoreductase YjgC